MTGDVVEKVTSSPSLEELEVEQMGLNSSSLLSLRKLSSAVEEHEFSLYKSNAVNGYCCSADENKNNLCGCTNNGDQSTKYTGCGGSYGTRRRGKWESKGCFEPNRRRQETTVPFELCPDTQYPKDKYVGPMCTYKDAIEDCEGMRFLDDDGSDRRNEVLIYYEMSLKLCPQENHPDAVGCEAVRLYKNSTLDLHR